MKNGIYAALTFVGLYIACKGGFAFEFSHFIITCGDSIVNCVRRLFYR